MRITESVLRRMVRSEILREAGEQMPGNVTMGRVPGKYTYEIIDGNRYGRSDYWRVNVLQGDRVVDGILIDGSDSQALDGAWEIKSLGFDDAPHPLKVFLWTLGIEIASLVGEGAVPEYGLYHDDVYDADIWRRFMRGTSGVNKIEIEDSPWEKNSQYRYRYIKSPSALMQLKNSGLLTADSGMPPGI